MEDSQLVNEYKQGNQNCFDVLVERYKKRVYFFALKLSNDHQEAEDISQETFLRVYKNLHNFRGDSSLVCWIFTIATNYYRSLHRKTKLSIAKDVTMEEIPVDSDKKEPQIMSQETQKQLKNAIDKLPKKQRIALVLRTFEKMSYEEISQIMDISLSSVKANISYARKTLREQLAELV